MMIHVEEITLSEALLIRHQVLWPDADITASKVKGDESAVHFGGRLGDRIICCLSLFSAEGRGIQIRKFATLGTFQRHGYGSQLFQFALIWAFSRETEKIFLDARLTAIPFYKKYGFYETSEIFVKSDREYVRMEKKNSDAKNNF